MEVDARPTVLFVSGLFITDRMLMHSRALTEMARFARPVVWSEAVHEPAFENHLDAAPFFAAPAKFGNPPHALNLARHLTNHVHDLQGKAKTRSRNSFWQLRTRHSAGWIQRVLRNLAHPMAGLRLGRPLEKGVGHLLARRRDEELEAALEELAPAAVVLMVPWIESHVHVTAQCQRLGIPTFAVIPSWDNITTKGRIGNHHSGYFVWSSAMAREIRELYSGVSEDQIDICGPLQYDFFSDPTLSRPRQEFWHSQGVDPSKPVALYCLGSPNLIQEHHGVLPLIEELDRDPAFAELQLVVRPHPAFAGAELDFLRAAAADSQRLFIQDVSSWSAQPYQTREALGEWADSIRHCDVLVNLSSTMTVDACLLDRPVINLDYDPQPGSPQQALVKAINREWDHFAPLVPTGGIAMAGDVTEVARHLLRYLEDPTRDSNGRRKIVDHVCGDLHGKAGTTLAQLLEARLSHLRVAPPSKNSIVVEEL
jgi:hypothetical protein